MIKIQKAEFGDLKPLQEIGRTTFFETFAESKTEANMQHYLAVQFSLDRLSMELCENNSWFFIAWDGELAIGYLKVNVGDAETESKEDHFLEIERMYVLKAYQGKKVGQQLYERALELAADL